MNDLMNQFKLDYGTKPTTATLETINVIVEPQIFVGDYAKAYCSELERRNPDRFDATDINQEELNSYFLGLIGIRLDQIQGNCKVWRQAKELYIPSWIQFILSGIGIVTDYTRGLILNPKFSISYDIDVMLDTSNKLRVFSSDGVSMHKDAFPRDIEGDPDMMGMAIINGYVQSMSEIPHPIQSYVAAFLGLRLEEEANYKMMYRIRYDEVNFIKQMLMHEEAII